MTNARMAQISYQMGDLSLTIFQYFRRLGLVRLISEFVNPVCAKFELFSCPEQGMEYLGIHQVHIYPSSS